MRHNTGPAPGSYEPKLNSSAKSPVFGSDKRRPLSANTIAPGPGTYEIPSMIKEGPQFSMTSKNFKNITNTNPGPGQYNHTDSDFYAEKAPAFSYGKSSRGPFGKADYVPGPGTYTAILQEAGPKCVFGSDRRSKETKHTNPGPGTYTLASSLDRRAYSMLGKHKARSHSETPGPGAYNPSHQLSVPSYRLGTGMRIGLTGTNPDGSPGPGAYNPTKKDRARGGV
jgi:hypothetical protein